MRDAGEGSAASPEGGAASPAGSAASPEGGAASSASTDAPRHGGWLLAVAVVLCAVNLRPAVSSVGPVLTEIRDDLGLSAAAVSALTALPVLFFGLGALVAPALARRYGTEVTLTGVLAATTAGLLVRLGPDVLTLFAGTLLAGAAIAIANVLVPALVKREYPHRTGAMMGAYVGSVAGGAALAAGITVPLADALGGGWRAGLGPWAGLAALALAVWGAVLVSRRRRSTLEGRTNEIPASLLSDALAWQVTLFMALQSLIFYTLLSWLPTLFRAHGIAAEVAGGLASVMVVIGVPSALVFPSLLTRVRRQSGWAVATVGCAAVGMTGLLLAPASAPLLWAVLLGLGNGAAFPLALTLVVLRSRDANDAAQLSAMSQSVGYALAAGGPLAFGLLHDLTGGWTVPVFTLLLLLLPQALIGIGAGRDRYVGSVSSA